MATNLLNPWALDSEGKLINAEKAEKGQQYTCPICKETLKLCKKGTGPNARRDHFKHNSDSHCPGPTESDIHIFAKEGIYKILHSAIENRHDIPIAWTCPECGMDFKANLLKKAKSVEMEKDLGTSRPDIALLDENGKVIVALEIVYTHEPNLETIKFYNEQNIVLIRYVFHSIEECNFLFAKLKFPDSLNMCFRHSCPSCQSMPFPRKLVPLHNQENKVIGFAVGMDAPFFDDPFIGLPFNDQVKQDARLFVQQHCPQYQLQFRDEQIPHVLFVRPQIQPQPKPINPRSLYRGNPFAPTPLEKAQKQERRKNAIKTNYAKMSKSAKKTGGKRRK